jgi:hypothetical protein
MPIPPFDRKRFPGYTDTQWKLVRIGWNHARKAARPAVTSEQTTAAYELLRDSEFPPPGILRTIAPDGTLTLRPISANGWMHGEFDIGPTAGVNGGHPMPLGCERNGGSVKDCPSYPRCGCADAGRTAGVGGTDGR